MSTVVCPKCGGQGLLPGARFCDQCGTRVPNAALRSASQYEELRARLQDLDFLRARIAALETENKELTAFKAEAVAEIAEHQPLRSQVKELESLRAKVAALEAEKGELEAFKAEAGKREQEAKLAGRVTGPTVAQLVVPRTRRRDTTLDRRLYLGPSLVAFGLLTVAASVAIGAMSLSGLGLASFLIGLLLVYLPSRPSVAPELVEASVLSSLANLERVLHELGPGTKAVYLRVRDRLDAPMIFLPLEDNPPRTAQINASDADGLLLVDAKDTHRTGLLLQAPGASLLAFMEKESGVDFMDLSRNDLLDALRSGMVESLEAVADLKGEFTNDGLKLRIRDGALDSLSRSVAKSTPSVASRIGCPICSAAICGTVKTLKRDIVLEEAAHQPGLHIVTLTYSGGPTDEAD